MTFNKPYWILSYNWNRVTVNDAIFTSGLTSSKFIRKCIILKPVVSCPVGTAHSLGLGLCFSEINHEGHVSFTCIYGWSQVSV